MTSNTDENGSVPNANLFGRNSRNLRCLLIAWVRNGGHIYFPSLPTLLELGIGTRTRHPASVPRDIHLTALCHSLTLAPNTGLARGRQLSGPGQHFPPPLPLPFSHINGVFSIVRDIKGLNKQYQAQFGPIQALHVKPSITTLFSRSMVIRGSNYFLQPFT